MSKELTDEQITTQLMTYPHHPDQRGRVSEPKKYQMSKGRIVKPQVRWHKHHWDEIGSAPAFAGLQCRIWVCRVCKQERELFKNVEPKPTWAGKRTKARTALSEPTKEGT